MKGGVYRMLTLHLPQMQDRAHPFLSESRQMFQCGLFRYHFPQQERQAIDGQTDYRTGDYRENRTNQRIQEQGR